MNMDKSEKKLSKVVEYQRKESNLKNSIKKKKMIFIVVINFSVI